MRVFACVDTTCPPVLLRRSAHKHNNDDGQLFALGSGMKTEYWWLSSLAGKGIGQSHTHTKNTHSHRWGEKTRAYAAVYCCYNMYKVTSIRITLQHTTTHFTRWQLHFVLGFIMHRLGLHQMPIKYELITTILCRSLDSRNIMALSRLLSGCHSRSLSLSLYHWRNATRKFFCFPKFELHSLFCGQLPFSPHLITQIFDHGECAHLFRNF